MNDYTDQETGATISFTRDTVTISNELPLWYALKSGEKRTDRIAITLTIPRRDLPYDPWQSDPIITDAAHLLSSLRFHGLKHRKRKISLPLINFSSIRLHINRSDIITLKRFLDNSPQGYDSHHENLKYALLLSFFLSRFLPRLSKLPRGRAKAAYRLTSLLPAALYACREIIRNLTVSQTERLSAIVEEMIDDTRMLHKKLRDLMATIVQEDEYVLTRFLDKEPDAIVLSLVHRAFFGVWEMFGHPGLLEADPDDLYREYLYGRKTEKLRETIGKAKELGSEFYGSIAATWERLYLGERGAATRAFFPEVL